MRLPSLLLPILTAVTLVALGGSAQAQTTTPPPQESQPGTVSAAGDTGLWFVPTSEVLQRKKWSFSFWRTEMDEGQGFTDISHFPITFGVGVGDRAEIFGRFVAQSRVDRDTRPLFFASGADEADTGTGGGIGPDAPQASKGWSTGVGDFWLGGKVRLTPSDSATGFAIRAQLKLPTGDE